MGRALFSALDTARLEHVSARAMRAWLDEEMGGASIWERELAELTRCLGALAESCGDPDVRYAVRLFGILSAPAKKKPGG